MYITCQECDTIYRLDENLLKAEGSKVRCSQCGYVFIACPPPPAPDHVPLSAVMADAAPASIDQPDNTSAEEELAGIDMSELDSILNQDAGGHTSHVRSESDLDDLESELSINEISEASSTPEIDEIDPNMDFKLYDSGPVDENNGQDSEEVDLDLDFDDTLMAAAEKIGLDDEFNHNPEDLALDELDRFEEPTAAEAATTDAADGNFESDEGLSLEDLDLDFEEPPAAKAATTGAADGNFGSDEGLSLEDLDLDLDLDFEEPPAAEAATTGAADGNFESDEGLSLEDLDLDFEESPAAEAATTDAAGEDLVDPDDISLDDISLDESNTEAESLLEDEHNDLNTPFREQAGQTADDSKKTEMTDDLDLDMDFDLDSIVQKDMSFDEEPELKLDESFELDASGTEEEQFVENESSEPKGESFSGQDEELDLSDLDELSGAYETEGNYQEDTISDENGKQDAPKEQLEDLRFELDAEFEDKPVSPGAGSENSEPEDEDLDLSDLERMLEDNETDSAMEDLTATTGLDAGDKWMDTPATLSGSQAADELDLSDIEEAIEGAGRQSREPSDSVDQELELDLSFESGNVTGLQNELGIELEPDNTGKGSQANDIDPGFSFDDEKTPAGDSEELELEMDESSPKAKKFGQDDDFDLSELDNLIDQKDKSGTVETIDSGDIELEFHIDDEQEETPVAAKTRTAGIQPALHHSEETMESAPVMKTQAESKPARPVKRKKRSNTAVVFLLIIVLLGAGGYFGWDYAKKSGITIASINTYIDEYFNPKPKDPMGTLSLSTMEINSKFIENENNGLRLFVITGKVQNQYPTGRGMIRLQGNLYTKGKVLSKSEKAFAGLKATDQELVSMPVADLKARLSTPPKPQDTAATVPAGQAIPFMVVFSDLPDDLDEFAIELISSSPVQ